MSPGNQSASLADDSGLAVNALGGAPGIYSARYAGVHATIKQIMKNCWQIWTPSRTEAPVVCVLALVRSADDPPVIAQGLWQGEILPAPQGENGFGYIRFLSPRARRSVQPN